MLLILIAAISKRLKPSDLKTQIVVNTQENINMELKVRTL